MLSFEFGNLISDSSTTLSFHFFLINRELCSSSRTQLKIDKAFVKTKHPPPLELWRTGKSIELEGNYSKARCLRVPQSLRPDQPEEILDLSCFISTS
jgi:hypothetical protein